jgi:hypothetical protein
MVQSKSLNLKINRSGIKVNLMEKGIWYHRKVLHRRDFIQKKSDDS